MKWTYRNQINNFLTAVSNNSEGEIWVYGDITSDKWSDDDVTPTSIRDALDSMGPVGALNIRVNSYGGSVYAGNAIINIIDSYRRKNNVTVNAYSSYRICQECRKKRSIKQAEKVHKKQGDSEQEVSVATLPYKPYPWQVEAEEAFWNHRFTVLACGNRSGYHALCIEQSVQIQR